MKNKTYIISLFDCLSNRHELYTDKESARKQHGATHNTLGVPTKGVLSLALMDGTLGVGQVCKADVCRIGVRTVRHRRDREMHGERSKRGLHAAAPARFLMIPSCPHRRVFC